MRRLHLRAHSEHATAHKKRTSSNKQCSTSNSKAAWKSQPKERPAFCYTDCCDYLQRRQDDPHTTRNRYGVRGTLLGIRASVCYALEAELLKHSFCVLLATSNTSHHFSCCSLSVNRRSSAAPPPPALSTELDLSRWASEGCVLELGSGAEGSPATNAKN